ncbi:MAG TPA: hypothetical protein VF066_03940 [Thermoleophilaceae bacterium]
MTFDPNQHDRFVLKQRIRLVVNQYEFSLPNESWEPAGEPFAFVHQRRFKFKEDIRFYTDESKAAELMRIKARQRFDPRATYDVTDPLGQKIGAIQKVFGKSLLRSTYRMYDASGEEVAIAREKSVAVALIRRIVGFVPYLDNVADWLPIPYHFEFVRGEDVIGHHTRQLWKIRDVYRISVQGDPGHKVDRRLILAIAVGMDALQAR